MILNSHWQLAITSNLEFNFCEIIHDDYDGIDFNIKSNCKDTVRLCSLGMMCILMQLNCSLKLSVAPIG